MGICNWFLINKGGTYPIYDVKQNYKKVGTLYDREAFILHGGDEYEGISFLGSDGTIKTATIDPYRYPMPGSTYHYCTDYPYSTENINGTTYKVFKMRRTMNVYKGSGAKWGTVAAGMYVATNSPDVGENHPTWKLINYVKSTNGNWVKVEGDGYGHGFVDTGLSIASGYASIPFYGSW